MYSGFNSVTKYTAASFAVWFAATMISLSFSLTTHRFAGPTPFSIIVTLYSPSS